MISNDILNDIEWYQALPDTYPDTYPNCKDERRCSTNEGVMLKRASLFKQSEHNAKR